MNSLNLPAKITLSNGNKTKWIEKGEKFLITCIEIKMVDGKAFIVTEIGEIAIPTEYDTLDIASRVFDIE